MNKKVAILAFLLLVMALSTSVSVAQDATPAATPSMAVTATPGQAVNMVLLPKFLGILPFDQTHQGAEEAAAELQNPTPLQFLGPTADNSVAGQIEIVTTAATQGVNVVMMSNNAGEQIVPAVQAAVAAGVKVVTWDSPIPSATGETLFVAQVDFGQMGATLAKMALDILGPDGGQFAILSASPDAANQNSWIAAMLEELKKPEYAKLELVATVYGNDQSEESYNQALGLVDKYPDLRLIVAPTSVGAPAAAKALQDEGLCGAGDNKVVVTGLAAPEEMLSYTENGCAPQYAWWSFVDLGYLTYYISYMVATGELKGEVGETFIAGRMGEYTITADPNRPDVDARRVLMGPFTIYNIDNIHELMGPQPTPEATAEATAAG